MPRIHAPSLLCALATLSLAGCVSSPTPALNAAAPVAEVPVEDPVVLIQGRAEILGIDSSGWTVTADGRVMAGGAATIWLKITEPAQYRDPHRGIGVYDLKELQIDGHQLAAGDVISFEAEDVVFRERRLPDVLGNLVHLRIVKAASTPPRPSSNK